MMRTKNKQGTKLQIAMKQTSGHLLDQLQSSTVPKMFKFHLNSFFVKSLFAKHIKS